MKKQDKNGEFLKAVNEELNQRVNAIDDSTREALRNIRKKAIAQEKNTSGNTWQWWRPYPVIAATAGIVLVVSVSLRMNMTKSIDALPSPEDIALLTSSDDISFYQELEFYQWLEAEKING